MFRGLDQVAEHRLRERRGLRACGIVYYKSIIIHNVNIYIYICIYIHTFTYARSPLEDSPVFSDPAPGRS